MRGWTNVKNSKSDNLNLVAPIRFTLKINNNYYSTDNNFSNRNYANFSVPLESIKKYTTLKILKTECETNRDLKCEARVHFLWNANWKNINSGVVDYEGNDLMKWDISNIQWEYDNSNDVEIVGISGNYNTYATVLFELS